MKGILLDENDDLKVVVKREAQGLITQGIVLGETKIQDAYMVLKMNKGELKEDPIVGANLLRMLRGTANRERIKKTIKISLQRVGIEFDEIKHAVAAMLNNKKIEL